MNYKIILSVFIITLFTIAACSEIEDEITVNETLGVHGKGAKDKDSDNFHGYFLTQINNGTLDNCKECHGSNFAGGVTEQSCTGCHKTIAVHQDGIETPGSDNFHATYMLANSNTISQCTQCHGDDYKGGASSPTCANCHSGLPVHVGGIQDIDSENFHGRYLAVHELGLSACNTCHGNNFEGGALSPECATCHPSIGIHKDGIMDSSSPNFHAKYIETNNINMDDCKACHGENFNGGMSAPGCNDCHSTVNVHKPDMLEPTSPDFHGKYIADNNVQLSSCASCHGKDFSGGTSAPGCTTCHSSIGVHQDGIQTPESDNFHGKYLGVNNFELSSCATCHGNNFEGGLAAPACLTCHSTINIHKEGITNSSSSNFHVNYMSINGVQLNACATCHGDDFSGGSSAKACTTCHSSIGVHQNGIMTPGSDQFHGKFLGINEMELNVCQTCHGDNFEGGVLASGCTTCHSTITIHTDGIMTTSSNEFHGTVIGDNEYKLTQCASCHGDNFEGGDSAPTCVTCHNSIDVHKTGIIDGSSNGFHGVFLAMNTWEVNSCASCHQSDFSGSTVSPTCVDCHTQSAGPIACNTCHGNFNDQNIIAPPNGLRNKSDRNQYTGAHTLHLTETTIAATVECDQCHIIPRTFESEAHIDDGQRSEIIFGNLADPNSSASYDFGSTTCSNTYCHGNFEFNKADSEYPEFYNGDKMVGNKFNPNWLAVDNGQAECGTCHGEVDVSGQFVSALPKGHDGTYDLTKCSTCHQAVMDASGNIIAPARHINGKIDVFTK